MREGRHVTSTKFVQLLDQALTSIGGLRAVLEFYGIFFIAAAPSAAAFGFEASLAWKIAAGLVTATGVILGGRLWISRTQDRLRDRIRREELAHLAAPDFDRVNDLVKLKEEKERVDYDLNRRDAFLLNELRLTGTSFFDDGAWKMKPGVNILLGQNGYGKSLVLRAMAALIQQDDNRSSELLHTSTDGRCLELEVLRNGSPMKIRREEERFTHAVGRIPLLAIPDSRFVNRSTTELSRPKSADLVKQTSNDENDRQGTDLRDFGAQNFLKQTPYEDTITGLLYQMCLDYRDDRSFQAPTFRLVENVIFALTGSEFHFHAIRRVGDSFVMEVVTEGNPTPLPIQYASQGTLSVVAVIGLIRKYLSQLFPKVRDDKLLEQPAIVIIDELDAHLHPVWQQKLTGLLRKYFPNVQFILTAHSPLVVSGCWTGEVAVLRKSKTSKRFMIEPVERDFIGTPLEEIYKTIFEIEGDDEVQLKHARMATAGTTNQSRIAELEGKTSLTEVERREIERLIREDGIVRKMASVAEERVREDDHVRDLEAEVEALRDKVARLERERHSGV